jgi:hypothetical protein
VLQSEIDRIGARLDRGLQLGPVARRAHNLWLFRRGLRKHCCLPG